MAKQSLHGIGSERVKPGTAIDNDNTIQLAPEMTEVIAYHI